MIEKSKSRKNVWIGVERNIYGSATLLTRCTWYRKTNLLIVVAGAQHFAHGSRGLHNPVAVDRRQLLGEAQLDFLTNSRESVPFPSANRNPGLKILQFLVN